MAVPGYEELMYYATPPNSYIGTSIFLLYIVLALYATTSITYSLYTQYNSIYNDPSTKIDERIKTARQLRARHIKIYAFLASISFATISYNMLFFLITHYLQWTGDKNRSLAAVSGEKIKRWMLESALFEDFARELVQDAPSAMWTMAVVLATWFWNIWMAQKARLRNLSTQTISTYILLSQILPISLTISLFTMNLHLTSPDIQPPKSTPKPTTTTATPLSTPAKTSLQLPNILLNATLLSLPSLRTHQLFIPLILFSRLLLLLPYSKRLSLHDAEVVKCISISGAFFATAGFMMRKEVGVGRMVRGFGEGGYAVRAMSWDGVLGAVVFGALGWGGGV